MKVMMSTHCSYSLNAVLELVSTLLPKTIWDKLCEAMWCWGPATTAGIYEGSRSIATVAEECDVSHLLTKCSIYWTYDS